MNTRNSSTTGWTAVDLTERFGAIPLHRIIWNPPPGTATVADALSLDDHEDRLCELIDGTLIEKDYNCYASYLATQTTVAILGVVKQEDLGVVTGAGGPMQLFPDQLRIPDAAFISWDHLKDSGFPENPAPLFAPDLAVEVISEGNTKKEMDRKLTEYFQAGSKLVWYVYPKTKTVEVYTASQQKTTLAETQVLTGGDVLPGLDIKLADLFKLPSPKEA